MTYNIAIDARKLSDFGIGTYTRNLINALSEQDRENQYVLFAGQQGAQELVDLPEDEKAEYLLLSGVEENGLVQLIRKSYSLLELISYFSMNDNEVRAWTIRDGWTAPQAAGVIHTDFERGFIRAEVISYDAFETHGSSAAAKGAGALRIEGKEYIVEDGDVIYFRFNV